MNIGFEAWLWSNKPIFRRLRLERDALSEFRDRILPRSSLIIVAVLLISCMVLNVVEIGLSAKEFIPWPS